MGSQGQKIYERTHMWDRIFCISIPGFLIVGGILNTRTEGDSLAFWKRKAKSIILPWLFMDSAENLPEKWEFHMNIGGNREYSAKRIREHKKQYQDMEDFFRHC